MDIVLYILAGLCLLIGLVGCVLPGLPGVPLSYLGLILMHVTDKYNYSWQFLIIWLVVVILVSVLDFVIPARGTKKFGGTKAGAWGATIGVVVGLFAGPWGIILGPFIGAVVGELIANKKDTNALKAGFGSFIGIMSGTVLKLICCGMMIYYYIKTLVGTAYIAAL